MSFGFEMGDCCTGMTVISGHADAIISKQLSDDQLDLHVGEVQANTHMGPATKWYPAVVVPFVLSSLPELNRSGSNIVGLSQYSSM